MGPSDRAESRARVQDEHDLATPLTHRNPEAQGVARLVVPDDRALIARVRLDHYVQLVLAELHVAVNCGDPIEACATRARALIPCWSTDRIGDALTDRATNPMLRTYLWAYPTGLDWFVALTDRGTTVATQEVIRAAYRAPLTPAELGAVHV